MRVTFGLDATGWASRVLTIAAVTTHAVLTLEVAIKIMYLVMLMLVTSLDLFLLPLKPPFVRQSMILLDN